MSLLNKWLRGTVGYSETTEHNDKTKGCDFPEQRNAWAYKSVYFENRSGGEKCSSTE